MQARSAALYAAASVRRDLRYGAQPAQRFDWLSCGQPDAPLFVFVHGGYWQHCAKEDFAYAASGPLARGFDVILAEYTLAPIATMTDIVGEIGALLDYLANDPDGLGTAKRPIHLSGHSAGGHLTAVHRAHPAVVSALAISPLVDLEPISLCCLNDKLQLTAHEVEAYSPVRHVPARQRSWRSAKPSCPNSCGKHATTQQHAKRPANGSSMSDCPACSTSTCSTISKPDGAMLTAFVDRAALGAPYRAGRPGV